MGVYTQSLIAVSIIEKVCSFVVSKLVKIWSNLAKMVQISDLWVHRFQPREVQILSNFIYRIYLRPLVWIYSRMSWGPLGAPVLTWVKSQIWPILGWYWRKSGKNGPNFGFSGIPISAQRVPNPLKLYMLSILAPISSNISPHKLRTFGCSCADLVIDITIYKTEVERSETQLKIGCSNGEKMA